MVWILALVALVAAFVYGAHLLLGSADSFSSLGRIRPLPRALVYAAAVVVGSQVTEAAIGIQRVSGHQLRLPSDDKGQAIVQVLSTTATDIAWQAGLLLAAAALLASTTGGETRRVQ